MLTHVVLATGDPALARRLSRLVTHQDIVVHDLENTQGLEQRLPRQNCDLVAIELTQLGPDPAAAAAHLRQHPDQPGVVVLSRDEDPSLRARLLTAGCLAVLCTSVPDRVLRATLRSLLARHREQAQARMEPSVARPRLSDFVSRSPSMQHLLTVVERVKGADTSLLIVGETGVGKEWLARSIHDESQRAAGPFVAINCAAFPEQLLESELFGHEEGAFTGATHARRGYFELAHRGTLFLDEIGEMPMHLQAKLLRVLQAREVQRIGAETPTRIDVRLMAATNRDITEDVAAGRFRKDLFYRLSVVMLAIPPLRERLEDIPALATSSIEHFRASVRREVRDIAPEALQALLQYPWPGNVRELMNVIERAMLLTNGPTITLQDLPEGFRRRSGTRAVNLAFAAAPLPEDWVRQPLGTLRQQLVAQLERAYLTQVLSEARGRVGEAARRAGLQPRSLFAKMKALGLRKEQFRPTPARRGPVAGATSRRDSTPSPQQG